MAISVLRIAVIVLTLLVAGIAYSDNPSTTPPKASHKPEANPKQHEQHAAADQRGTESSPVFIKVIPTMTVEPQPTKETDNCNEYLSPEWWMIYITGALVLFTLGLMIYTAKLWRATNTLAEDAKRTADRQADQMKQSLAIAQESITLAREEFISTHRPRIIVRRVSINIAKGIGIPDTLGIEFIIANVGNTSTKIIEHNTNLRIYKRNDTLPAILLYGDSRYPSISLESGVSCPIIHHTTGGEIEEYRLVSGFTEESGTMSYIYGNTLMIFFGYIIYEDGLKRRRRTAFLRNYDFVTKHFTPSTDSEYEYQD